MSNDKTHIAPTGRYTPRNGANGNRGDDRGFKSQVSSNNQNYHNNQNTSNSPNITNNPAAPISDKGQDKIEDDDLPEGWTKVMSNTHKIPFYYHKTTKTTVWVKPTADTLTEDRPPSPPAPPPNDTQVKEQNQVTTVEKTESSPVTPANVDEVASAYANRKVVQSAQGQNGEQAMRPPPPTGPSNWR
ncbi:hypothetical protein TREMEDRAFT_71103, partial [Tremella mesenterica DSM 1558]|uniref:uncharacterized protein n=1 Tax=Tremella mesenterica (strain ATCC 24925 / CBS 8224 / DSM 1558 / NBRC 9311 / NRRL Y-6157 / RJB 2259-6 / UBC 559-6) TaxID=578456 RepID=UPI0003F49C27